MTLQIIEKAVSNLGFVNSLEGGLRDMVVECYIRSFEYTHGESYSFVLGIPIKTNRHEILKADSFASHVVSLCGAHISHRPHYERTPSVIL